MVGDLIQPIVAEVLVFVVALTIVKFRPDGFITVTWLTKNQNGGMSRRHLLRGRAR